MCLQNPTLLSLCLGCIPTGIRHADTLGPLQLSSCLRATSSVSPPGSRRWRRLSFGHLSSLKDLGGWRVRWWKGLGGVFPVPEQRARPEWITSDAGRSQHPSVTGGVQLRRIFSSRTEKKKCLPLIKNSLSVCVRLLSEHWCCKHCPKRLYCTGLHP